MTSNRRVGQTVAVLLGLLAGALEMSAAAAVMWSPNRWLVLSALAVHALACWVCSKAANLRTTLSEVEADVVVMTAMFVPVFGPMIAWAIPLGEDRRRIAGSSEMLHRVEADILSSASVYERRIYSGDFERDLSRELNAMSYYEVLQSGDLDQKRNALRKLAQLGKPRHLRMIKTYFEDPESELRLCAYLEIDRLRTHRETHIAELRSKIRQADEHTADPVTIAEIEACSTELAEALRAFGSSGILDSSMARYRLTQALETATATHERFPDNWRVALVKARILCDLDDFQKAEQTLNALPRKTRELPSVQVAQAGLCFNRRQFGAARAIARKLLQQGERLPDWLEVLLADSPEEPPPEPSVANEPNRTRRAAKRKTARQEEASSARK